MNNQFPIAEDVSTSSHKFVLPKRNGDQATAPAVPPKRPSEHSFSFDEEVPPQSTLPSQPPKMINAATGVQAVAVTAQRFAEEKPTLERDPNFISVELPSGFHFYPFKEISLGSIRVKHQGKFARAAAEQSARITCETVSSLIGENTISAFDLTIPDFYWVLYYLRLNNFSKNQMTHRAVCNSPAHVMAVRAGEKDKETLVTVDIVSKSRIKETQLDIGKLEAFIAQADLEEFTSKGYMLTAPRMRDALELEEKWAGKENFEENEFLADLASCVCPIDGSRVSLEERMKFVGELSPDASDILDDFRDIVQSYGVEEKISTRCKDCNAVIETELSITAFDFLRQHK